MTDTPNDPHCSCDESADKVNTLATQALLMAVLDQERPTGALIREVSDSYGGHGLLHAMLLWVDTFYAVVGLPDPGQDVGLRFVDRTLGDIDTDDVPPPVAWVGRFMAARGANDLDTAQALVESLPRDPQVHGEIVWNLVRGIALNLRAVSGQL